MKIVLFDSNIYDKLEKNPHACELIRLMIAASELRVIVTRSLAEELQAKPFFGVPRFFPVEYSGNTVAMAGIMCCGDSLGNGAAYKQHIGNSSKRNDALIADAAMWKADWLVSEDDRMRRRLPDLGRCVALSYEEFMSNFKGLCEEKKVSTRVYLVPKKLLNLAQQIALSEKTSAATATAEEGACTCWNFENYLEKLYGVVLTESDEAIGALYADGLPDRIDAAWWMVDKYRNKRYGLEAVDRLALLLKAKGGTGVTDIRVQGTYAVHSQSLKTRFESHFS